MLARVLSAALIGIEAALVRVEVDVASGLPVFTTVGLPDSAVRESRERVRTAIRNAGYTFPSDRITVNLAPAGLRKEGPAFDLPIALGILTAIGRVRRRARGDLFAVVGELALDGQIRPVRGALAVGLTCRRKGVPTLLVPRDNAREVMAVEGLRVVGAATLQDAVNVLNSDTFPVTAADPVPAVVAVDDLDLVDVRGQAHAKRALEIAAAGAHNVLLVGPPGAGKTMLARRLTALLPPLTDEEALEVSAIWSVAGLLGRRGLLRERPFRSPHHTVSVSGLLGGGSAPHPGEVTLAHRGVLFMDELPEFQQHVLESLRQPLEDGAVSIARAAGVSEFPARFQLVAAANPCRRGCASLEQCVCTPAERDRYLGRLSGPLLDRIDLQVELPAVGGEEFAQDVRGDDSATVRKRVAAARDRQRCRHDAGAARVNGELTPRQLRRVANVTGEGRRLLAAAMTQLGLSARGHDRALKVARTIADLAGADAVDADHCAEALQYRGLDRRWRA